MYIGDGIRVQVYFLRVVRLQLSIGNFLRLQNVVDISTYFG